MLHMHEATYVCMCQHCPMHVANGDFASPGCSTIISCLLNIVMVILMLQWVNPWMHTVVIVCKCLGMFFLCVCVCAHFSTTAKS